MASEHSQVAETLGVNVGLAVPDSGAHEQGRMIIRRWDRDQTFWASKKLGGDAPGRPGFHQPHFHDFRRLGITPYSESLSGPNLVTTAGWGRILTLAIAGGGTAFDATHTRVGVGTATAAATMAQTDLSAATASANREWQMVTGVAATGGATGSTAAQLTAVATFGTGNANIAWAEWGIDQGTASGYGAVAGVLLNRAVSAQGTKTAGQTWTATCVLSWT